MTDDRKLLGRIIETLRNRYRLECVSKVNKDPFDESGLRYLAGFNEAKELVEKMVAAHISEEYWKEATLEGVPI